MFETKLPYSVFDADNHFYEPPDAITRYLPKDFVESGKIAAYRPNVADSHRDRIRHQVTSSGSTSWSLPIQRRTLSGSFRCYL